jgi:cytosine/adenosine deaminase-related metal-dependent hydrolase
VTSGRAAPRGGRLAVRLALLDAATWLAPAEIVWDAAGRIVSLRRARGRVADAVVLPGLVDAHAHLQIEAAPAGSREFLPWVQQVMAMRAASSPARLRSAARRAALDLFGDGVTAIGEIDSTGHSDAVFVDLRLAGRCYQELTGFHLDRRAANGLVARRARASSSCHRTGLSPHAPYSVSPALFAAAGRRARHLAVHCAEVPAEQQFLHTGRGPFAELLERLGRLPSDFRAPGVGAVRWLERLGVLRATTHLVHCQELERGDVARIAAAGCAIVVCPGTIRWFARTPPPVPRWLAAGVPVALGTDSRASCERFSLRHELRLAAAMWPELSPAQLFGMATRAGARALGTPGLGRLRRGGRADMLVLCGTAETPAEALAAFVRGEGQLLQVVRGGRQR